MNYQEFVNTQELKRRKAVAEGIAAANKSYNKGLLEGLGFFNAYLYPVLKRADT